MDFRSAKRGVIGIFLLALAVAATNYTPGTFLTGWDNLHPEFNFPVNLMRSLLGVWQDVRGLGLVDGMSHIANLPHTVLLWVLSVVLPTSLLRYAFTFLMFGLGGAGMYLLLRLLGLPGLIGSLLYLTNLATVQIFFTPLEAFTVHFAAIPWIAWSLLRYYRWPSKKHLLAFLGIAFLASPQFFVPTILLPITALLVALSLGKRHAFVALGGFLAIQAFWMLPWLATVRTTAPVIAEAKINRMSSEDAYARNVVYGTPLRTLTHQGFMLSYEDTDENGEFFLPMEAWRNHAMPVRILFAGIALWGVIVALRRRDRKLYPFLALAGVAFVFLANNTPGIREMTSLIREAMPLFAESMRFPFTKWALLFAFGMSIFVASALARAKRGVIAAVLVLLGVAFAPAFAGNFIYKNLRVAIPQEYFSLFSYMKSQPDGRIAILPQPDYWSWKHYRFGYRGSGFLWYGMRQPLLDRAFDPWSRENENFYWQLSLALYRKDPVALTQVLERYDVRYLLVDANLVSSSHSRALFLDEIQALLPQMPTFLPRETFGNLTMYARITEEPRIAGSLPYAGPAYDWSDTDQVYADLGDYITGTRGRHYTERNLFTKRNPLVKAPFLPSTSTSIVLTKQAVEDCGVLKSGTNSVVSEGTGLRLTSINQRLCGTVDLGPLPHTGAYLVAVESRHIAGRPLTFSLINQTARHTELEVQLRDGTNYLILPPLATDGIGYSAYIANDATGDQTSINDMLSIRVFSIPYTEILREWTRTEEYSAGAVAMLSQTYHPGWIAFRIQGNRIEPLTNHVMISNWKNGWILQSDQYSNPTNTPILFFFLPQLWEFVGFGLAVGILWLFFKR